MDHAPDPSTHHETYMPSTVSTLQWLHPWECQESATHTQEGGPTVRVSHKLVQARLRLQPLICPLVACSPPRDCSSVTPQPLNILQTTLPQCSAVYECGACSALIETWHGTLYIMLTRPAASYVSNSPARWYAHSCASPHECQLLSRWAASARYLSICMHICM